MEVNLRSCSTNFGRKGVFGKKFLTLFDPPVTSQVEKTNSTGLYPVHLEELFNAVEIFSIGIVVSEIPQQVV